MAPDRILVFLPCHALDDFPTWLEEQEADALLSAWTAAWHPWLIATVGAAPWWASVDLPPATDGSCLGIVPAPWDDRFATQSNPLCIAGSTWVRDVSGGEEILAAAARALGREDGAGPLPGDELAAEFRDFGLARLLAELLARRMRSSLDDEGPTLNAALVAAATSAVAGDAAAARAALRECYATLAATRARYYPVDVWLVDLVLLAETTLGRGLDRELDAPVPVGLVATGQVVEALAAANPAAVDRIRGRIAAGTLSPAGGRHDARPLDACAPEQILDSFDRGLAAWRGHVGTAPAVYAQCSGGSSAILPQLLTGLGFKGAVWSLFDGTPLPDPGAGRIRWEGTGNGCIDGIGRPPLDARLAKTILGLAGRIGDAMDHDHTVVIPFAHYAGTAGPWFDALRRIGAASSLLGTFVTPDDFFARTTGAGTTVSFAPDAFPVTLPADRAAEAAGDGGDDGIAADPVAAQAAAIGEAARGILAAREPLLEALPPQRDPAGAAPAARVRPRSGGGWGLGRLFTGAAATRDELVLEHGLVRVAAHRQTGGLLSVRRPDDRANRLSQRLSVRSTRPPPPPGRAWEDPLDRAEYAEMRADAVERVTTPSGDAAIESRGRLLGAGGRELGRFTQRIELAPGLPLVVLTLDVRLATRPRGPLLEHHAACRFAWNENEDYELCRGLHTQSVATERGRFTAPWFVGLGDPWAGAAEGSGGVVLLTGGLPWHLRSSPHMLDTILPSTPVDGGCRMAVGVGLERPWDVGLALCAGVPPADLRAATVLGGIPANVRLTLGGVRFAGGRLAGARVGLLESAGRDGEAVVEWAAEVATARVGDWTGTDPTGTAPTGTSPTGTAPAAPGPDSRVRIDGRTTAVSLRRHEWLPLDVEFRT
jgi:hypothetical protein